MVDHTPDPSGAPQRVSESSSGSWIAELRKRPNIIGIVCAIVGIVAGLLTGLYFYYKSEKAGAITMRVDQVQILDKNRIGQSPLKVVDAAGHVITDNVFAANVVVWNSGNAEITKEAVREPFRIRLSGHTTPLDLSLTYASTPYQKFNVSKNGDISWDHFDAGQGFKVSIIYVHDTSEKVVLTGSANESGGITDLQIVQQQEENAKSWLIIVIPVITIVFFVLPAIARTLIGGREPNTGQRWTYRISLWVLFGSMVIIAMWWLAINFTGLPVPPFK